MFHFTMDHHSLSYEQTEPSTVQQKQKPQEEKNLGTKNVSSILQFWLNMFMSPNVLQEMIQKVESCLAHCIFHM